MDKQTGSFPKIKKFNVKDDILQSKFATKKKDQLLEIINP